MSFGKFLKALDKGLKAAAKASAQRKTAKPKNFPVLVPDMLTPPDKIFTRAEAVKLYTLFMLEIGYLDKEDVDIDASEFGEQMDYLEQEIKENIEYLVDELKREKEYATEEKAELRQQGWSREELKEMLAEAEKSTVKAKAELDTAKEKLAAFKANRRAYLVAYVNNQVHGTPLPNMYTQGHSA